MTALIVVLVAACLLCAGIGTLYYRVLSGIGAQAPAAPALSANAQEQDASALEEPKTADKAGSATQQEPSGVTLTLSQTELTLAPGEQYGLSVSVRKPYGQDVYVFWSSSDEAVAQVGPSGMVTALAPGVCELIASDGTVSAICRVTVDELAHAGTHLLPSDERLLTEDDLAGFDQNTTMLARNEIFARHGRVFKTADIQTYFDAQSWYTADPGFDENAEGALTATERANLSFLVSYETERGWR